jgi:hypothetical protein
MLNAQHVSLRDIDYKVSMIDCKIVTEMRGDLVYVKILSVFQETTHEFNFNGQ